MRARVGLGVVARQQAARRRGMERSLREPNYIRGRATVWASEAQERYR